MTKILPSKIAIHHSPNICVVTGEASGDAQAALLLRELFLQLDSTYSFWGIGGSFLEKTGMELVFRIEQLAIFGVVEIAKHYFRVAEIGKNLLIEIEKRKPELIIVVDYPGFNLRLAEAAALRGFKVVYYIPPKVWAHGLSRIEKLKKYTSLIISILPFEADFFQKHGVNTIFIGNPLYDNVQTFLSQHSNTICSDVLKQFPTTIDDQLSYPYNIALLPGSRKSEIERVLPIMIEAFIRLMNDFPHITGYIPLAQTIQYSFIYQIFMKTCQKLNIDEKALAHKIKFLTNKTYDVLAHAHYAWVCSGTAALEASFFKIPMSVVYKVHPITAFLAKKLLKIKYASLMNLCMDAAIVPEFLQTSATVENLVCHVKMMLTDPDQRNKMHEELNKLNKLFPKNAAYHGARAILDLLK